MCVVIVVLVLMLGNIHVFTTIFILQPTKALVWSVFMLVHNPNTLGRGGDKGCVVNNFNHYVMDGRGDQIVVIGIHGEVVVAVPMCPHYIDLKNLIFPSRKIRILKNKIFMM
ncbi:hypothetical protein B0O99DRAFT_644697 [Bisporella sp. PMI_857]|nr:hypothetical protein B0O99DRAFT_644697 [Bisporella sp. PMI_857]